MERLPALAYSVVVAIGVAGAVVWFQRPVLRETAPLAVPAAAPPAAAPEPAPAPGPMVKYPIEALTDTPGPPPPPLDQADRYVQQALFGLIGRAAVLSSLRPESFVRRAVTTVDNLGRRRAPSAMWPVRQTPGHFAVLSRSEGIVVNPDNSLRYSPFVSLVVSVDTARAVVLYARLYPLFQRAYEELGYPGQYFNDRLVSVIDELLQTPERSGPLRVELTEVKGAMKSLQPWTRYRFSDPQLESLSAGQKMLLRAGPANERRLKAKLADIRRRLTGAALAQ